MSEELATRQSASDEETTSESAARGWNDTRLVAGLRCNGETGVKRRMTQ